MQTHTEIPTDSSAVTTATLAQAAGRRLEVAMNEESLEAALPVRSRAREYGLDHIESPLHD
jgi:hypothetical protein